MDMQNIEDIILNESECGYVEFKVEQYLKNAPAAFVKDMMAMANSSYVGNKYIIIGVEEKDNVKKLHGMTTRLEDPSRYDQLIHENIEPEIRFSSRMVEVEGKNYGVFTIEGCDDKPYMMKKDLPSLLKGECYIRKGTSVARLVRRDLDAIWEKKLKTARFDGDVKIGLVVDSNPDGLVTIHRLVDLPSDIEADNIRWTVQNRKSGHLGTLRMLAAIGTSKYNYMDDEELEDELANVKTTFRDEDRYHKFEKLGAKINFILTNTGTTYLENVSVTIKLPLIPGLEIAPKKYPRPDIFAIGGGLADMNFITQRQKYPTVIEKADEYEISQPYGDLAHQQPAKLFITDLRVFATHELAGKKLTGRVKIYGKNLPHPLEREIQIPFGE